ncbi:GNAT family N-acetyltransferase [Billgrantia sp. Q4P2]|uniref:N-acetyltransferase family protein n=1 Tax=Billgrantia sp. Q4P2 TaxID=3463857 RepID=UPI0040562174
MVTIRPYRQEDYEVLRSLVLCLHETLRPLDTDLAPGDQIIDRYFQELMTKVESTAGAVFVAEDDSGLVGYVCLWGCISPEDLDERPDPFSFMAELFVQPECRNLGVGRSLVERAERYAVECGTYKIELKVLARNEAAVRFYEALGYVPRVMIMSKYF